ncbi:MAG: HPr family phosphocarrier protein, partial [Lachnospiraceae bacterium]|nr:HPr family phosphocarrier protein [Lachnospiraceae bacterium]
MEKNLVKFNRVDDVKEFVAAAAKCDFDIDVTYNKVIVDAKSFLGVLSLASLPVLVAMHGENAQLHQLC